MIIVCWRIRRSKAEERLISIGRAKYNGSPTEVQSTTLLTRDGVLKQGLNLRVRGLFEGVVMGEGN